MPYEMREEMTCLVSNSEHHTNKSWATTDETIDDVKVAEVVAEDEILTQSQFQRRQHNQ